MCLFFMNKNNVIEICKNFGLSPNKKFGQNFLIDNNIIKKIINDVSESSPETLLEIGPGLGALTEIFVKTCNSITAVEIDSGLVKYLDSRYGGEKNFVLVHDDFLKVNLPDKFDVIVSNLPYYCATEILFKLARSFSARHIFVMIQKELAHRMVSSAGDKNYGAFSVTLNFYFNPELLFKVSGNTFYPKPDVSSSFVKLTRREVKLDNEEIEIFHTVVKSAFWGRRKTILRSLSDSPHMDISKEKLIHVLKLADVSGTLRGEDLSTKEFIRIAAIIYSLDIS